MTAETAQLFHLMIALLQHFCKKLQRYKTRRLMMNLYGFLFKCQAFYSICFGRSFKTCFFRTLIIFFCPQKTFILSWNIKPRVSWPLYDLHWLSLQINLPNLNKYLLLYMLLHILPYRFLFHNGLVRLTSCDIRVHLFIHQGFILFNS